MPKKQHTQVNLITFAIKIKRQLIKLLINHNTHCLALVDIHTHTNNYTPTHIYIYTCKCT